MAEEEEEGDGRGSRGDVGVEGEMAGVEGEMAGFEGLQTLFPADVISLRACTSPGGTLPQN